MRAEPFDGLRTAPVEADGGALRQARGTSQAQGRLAGAPPQVLGVITPSRRAIVAASTRLVTPSLLRMLDTCNVAVFGLMKSDSGDLTVGQTPRHQGQKH